MERGIASLNCAHYIPLCSNWNIYRHNIYQNLWWETSGFPRGVAEVFVLLRCYATLVGIIHRSFGTVYRYHLQGSTQYKNILRVLVHLEERTDRLYRKVGTYQPMLRYNQKSKDLNLWWPIWPPTAYWRVSAGRTVQDTNTVTDTKNKIQFFEHNAFDVIHCVHSHTFI
jgi:hypothetical protein